MRLGHVSEHLRAYWGSLRGRRQHVTEAHQLGEQAVVCRVRDGWSIEDVILVVVRPDGSPELLHSLPNGPRRRPRHPHTPSLMHAVSVR